MNKAVRFSVFLENEPWGNPSELEFPVNDYRWRSASYNKWISLVPFNKSYYHRSKDFGAIPDKLIVSVWDDGQILKFPLHKGIIGYNSILIKKKFGLEFYNTNCNTESIDPGI